MIIMQVEFYGQFLKKFSNIMKICPMGDELFHADGWMDGWTDMTKLIVAFCNLVKAPKKTMGHVEYISLYKA